MEAWVIVFLEDGRRKEACKEAIVGTSLELVSNGGLFEKVLYGIEVGG